MDIGKNVRTQRNKKKMSVKELAERSQITPGMISQLESNKANPSIKTMTRIADALSIPVSVLFSDDSDELQIVRKNLRPTTSFNGLIYESLISNSMKLPFGVYVATLTDEFSPDEKHGYAGTEFVLVMEGEVEYYTKDISFSLYEGDSYCYDASIPHTFRNLAEESKLLVVTIPIGFMPN